MRDHFTAQRAVRNAAAGIFAGVGLGEDEATLITGEADQALDVDVEGCAVSGEGDSDDIADLPSVEDAEQVVRVGDRLSLYRGDRVA